MLYTSENSFDTHVSYIVVVTFNVVDFDRLNFEVLPPCGSYIHFFGHMAIRN